MREQEEIVANPDDNVVSFRVGQAVPWPASPFGIAQVAELRRTCVRICYPCKTGRLRQPIVRARDLAELQRASPVLPLPNPLNRGVIERRKAFAVPPPRHFRKAA